MALQEILNKIRANAKAGQKFVPGANLPTPGFIQRLKKHLEEAPAGQIKKLGLKEFLKRDYESSFLAKKTPEEKAARAKATGGHVFTEEERTKIMDAAMGFGPGVIGSIKKGSQSAVAAFEQGLKNVSEEAAYKARQIALKEKAKLNIPGPKGFGQKVKEFFEPIRGVDKEIQAAYKEWANKKLKAKTLADEDLASFESGRVKAQQLETKPVTLPKPKKQALPPEIDEKITAYESSKQLLIEDPARQLVKYANKKTGELPEVLGHGGKFAKTGDQLAADLGFADSEAAREAYQTYLKKAKALKEAGEEIRLQKNLFKDEHELNKFLNIDESVLSSKRTLEFKPKKFVDEEGFQAIKDYQAGKSTPYVERIKLAFDNLFKEANKRGLNVAYRERYLPQVYANTPSEIQEATLKYLQKLGLSDDLILDYLAGKELPRNIAASFKLNPFFSKARLFPDYETAMKFGLSPKYTNPAQLVAHYRKELEETIANKEFLEKLLEKGKLLPEQMAPKHYQPISGNMTFKGYFASPELKKIIESKFRDEEALGLGETLIKWVAWSSKKAQEIALSAGVPYSNVNFFSIGQLVKQMTAGDFKSATAFIRANFNGASIKFFEKNQNYMSMMANQGIDLGTHVGSYDKVYKNIIAKKNWKNWFGETFDKMFNEKTFGSFMPQMYIQTFKDALKKGLAKGMTAEQAGVFAGNATKAMFGLFEDVGRGQAFSDAMSATFFAPKFREGIVRTLFNTVKSVTTEINNPAFYKNRQLLAGMVLTYGAYNTLNKKLNGHYMWDNPPGKEFALSIPRQDGEIVYVEFMPSFLSFVRNMGSGAIALAKGDITTAGKKFGTLFSMPIKITSEVLSNSDYFDRKIYKEYDSIGTKALKIAKYMGLAVSHPYIKELINQIEDKKPLHQSMIAALELPLKFSSKEKISAQQFYDALDKMEAKRAKARDRVKPLYEDVQKLLAAGNETEALKLHDSLTTEEKAIYKSIKTSDKRRQTQQGKSEIYDIFLQIQKMKKEGREQEALDIYNSLSDEDKHYYQLVKKQFLENQ